MKIKLAIEVFGKLYSKETVEECLSKLTLSTYQEDESYAIEILQIP